MFSTSLPDPKNVSGNSSLSETPLNSIISAIVTRDYSYPEHEGSLGLLCNFGGEANYFINRKKYIVSDHSFAVLNHGSRIAIDIQPKNPLESFYLFFRDDLPQ